MVPVIVKVEHCQESAILVSAIKNQVCLFLHSNANNYVNHKISQQPVHLKRDTLIEQSCIHQWQLLFFTLLLRQLISGNMSDSWTNCYLKKYACTCVPKQHCSYIPACTKLPYSKQFRLKVTVFSLKQLSTDIPISQHTCRYLMPQKTKLGLLGLQEKQI